MATKSFSKLIVVADCGHGVGAPLLSAFVSNNHRVIGFSPSRESLCSLRERFWPAFEGVGGMLDLWRTDLGNDTETRDRAEAALFTHGIPDVLITHVGGMPNRCVAVTSASSTIVVCVYMYAEVVQTSSLHPLIH